MPLRAVLSIVVAVLAVSCERAPVPPPAARSELRIISLSPAISRTLVDFGLADRIVGRSRYCDAVAPEVPSVGDLLAIDYERIIDLAPTHVLVQPPQSGVDAQLTALARTRGWALASWTGLDTIDDIERLVREIPAALYEPPSADRAEAARRAATLVNEIAASLTPVGDGAIWRGTTLLVYHREPVGVFGRGTYLHEVLVRLGGTNAVVANGWPSLTLEDVVRLDPGAMILVTSDVGAKDDPRAAAGVLGELDVEAVRQGRLAVLAHPDAQLPCTGVIGVAEELRAILRALATPAATGRSAGDAPDQRSP